MTSLWTTPSRGVIPELEAIGSTLSQLASGYPDALTMHKGIAERCFTKYAGKIPLVLKCSTFSPCHPDTDNIVCSIEEALHMGQMPWPSAASSAATAQRKPHCPEALENS